MRLVVRPGRPLTSVHPGGDVTIIAAAVREPPRGLPGIRPAGPSMRTPTEALPRRTIAVRVLVTLVAALSWAIVPPATAADPAKVLRVVFAIAETSFDPQFASDAASDSIIENIYEAMLDYDYLARPLQLVPRE